jgi:hypothetical protein
MGAALSIDGHGRREPPRPIGDRAWLLACHRQSSSFPADRMTKDLARFQLGATGQVSSSGRPGT